MNKKEKALQQEIEELKTKLNNFHILHDKLYREKQLCEEDLKQVRGKLKQVIQKYQALAICCKDLAKANYSVVSSLEYSI